MKSIHKRVIQAIGCSLSIVTLLITSQQFAVASNQPPVSIVFAVLTKRLETKSAILDQELTLRTMSDVVVDKVVVIPSGAKVVGHVVEVATRGQGSQQSILAIVIDKAVLENGREISLQAIVAAAAKPEDSALTSDPTYGMLHSNEPKMLGTGPTGTARSGDLGASSKAESSATLGTARINGEMRKHLLLNANSQGTIGFSGLSLSWRLDSPPAVSVFSSNNKEIKLEAGTQVLLRMAQPKIPGI